MSDNDSYNISANSEDDDQVNQDDEAIMGGKDRTGAIKQLNKKISEKKKVELEHARNEQQKARDSVQVTLKTNLLIINLLNRNNTMK